MALLDANGAMCAFGDVGQEYNNLPLAVTNVEGTEDMASADQYGWILPFALTKTGEHSRATAVRAARECLNIAIDESDLQPFGKTFVGCCVLIAADTRRSVVGDSVARAPEQGRLHHARAVRGLGVRKEREVAQDQRDGAWGSAVFLDPREARVHRA